jgi:hypothetical protein
LRRGEFGGDAFRFGSERPLLRFQTLLRSQKQTFLLGQFAA